MAASGGVLFLDEVGELPLEVQGKLLRVLEDRLITPEGTDTPIGPVDVQVIAATNRDVPGMVRRKEFREDLFYRLAVLRIAVPPLRDRREDIDAVVESALAGLATDRRLRKLTRQDCQALCQYDWPGNARQLINVLRRAVYMDLAIADVIEEERQIASPTVLETPEDPKRLLPASACEVRPIKEVQQAYAARALALHGDNLRATAKALGIAVNTLRSWLRGQ
jgi:transcriptional regulator with PAS, ATPase and Fis domain